MIQEPIALEHLFKKAVRCRLCFEREWVSSSLIDIAQPRWIGSQYYTSEPKILIILLNPGSGGDKRGANRKFLTLLKGYRDGKNTIDEIFQHQGQDIQNWGQGKFANFYLRGLNLNLDSIALANIAWCASAGNSYPKQMLSECFARHTQLLIQLLAPEIVVLSGSKAHNFREAIKAVEPNSKIICTLHYAHREGYLVERQELERVRNLIQAEHPEQVLDLKEKKGITVMALKYQVGEVVTFGGKTGRIVEAQKNDKRRGKIRGEMNKRREPGQWVSNLGTGANDMYRLEKI